MATMNDIQRARHVKRWRNKQHEFFMAALCMSVVLGIGAGAIVLAVMRHVNP